MNIKQVEAQLNSILKANASSDSEIIALTCEILKHSHEKNDASAVNALMKWASAKQTQALNDCAKTVKSFVQANSPWEHGTNGQAKKAQKGKASLARLKKLWLGEDISALSKRLDDAIKSQRIAGNKPSAKPAPATRDTIKARVNSMLLASAKKALSLGENPMSAEDFVQLIKNFANSPEFKAIASKVKE